MQVIYRILWDRHTRRTEYSHIQDVHIILTLQYVLQRIIYGVLTQTIFKQKRAYADRSFSTECKELIKHSSPYAGVFVVS